jgi:hypothetical protein
MAQDGDARGSNEPEDSRKGRSPETERHSDDQQNSVELRSRGAPASDLEVVALKLANAIHAADDKEDDEEEHQVREQAVDAEHDEHDGIVAGEVSQIVVDSALHFAKVGGLRDALQVEEL